MCVYVCIQIKIPWICTQTMSRPSRQQSLQRPAQRGRTLLKTADFLFSCWSQDQPENVSVPPNQSHRVPPLAGPPPTSQGPQPPLPPSVQPPPTPPTCESPSKEVTVADSLAIASSSHSGFGFINHGGVLPKTLSGCVKPWIVLNPYTRFNL